MARVLIHPGKHLAAELKALAMSVNELARILGVATKRLMQIIAGKRGSRAIPRYASASGSARVWMKEFLNIRNEGGHGLSD
jgi:hypothetical protein